MDGVFLVPYTLQLSQNRNKLTQQQSSIREGLESVGRVVKGALEGKDDADEVDEMERGEIGGKGKGKEGGEAKEEEQIWLHCSVGDAIDDEENAGEQPMVSSSSVINQLTKRESDHFVPSTHSLRNKQRHCKASIDYGKLASRRKRSRI